MYSYVDKCRKLNDIFKDITRKDVVVAFSGGVDSAVLLKTACDFAKENDTKVYAVTMQTMMHSVKEMNFTKETAKKIGALHRVIEINELENAGISNNPFDRCYLCKKYMFSKICEFAESIGAETVIEGTNADDLKVYRPGVKAIEELGIKSPLAEIGMTKKEVRQLAGEYKLKAVDKPSTPCLATRFEYGTHLDVDKFKSVEMAEEYIRTLGFYNVRLRVHNTVARIEVDEADIDKLMSFRNDIVSFVRSLGFKYVTVDMEGFISGSMDK